MKTSPIVVGDFVLGPMGEVIKLDLIKILKVHLHEFYRLFVLKAEGVIVVELPFNDKPDSQQNEREASFVGLGTFVEWYLLHCIYYLLLVRKVIIYTKRYD